MKDLDLRTETAARKRERKKAQRRAGIPTFEFKRGTFANYINNQRRLDNGYERLRERTEAEIRRARRAPVVRPVFNPPEHPRRKVGIGGLGALMLLAAAGVDIAAALKESKR